MTEIPEHLLKRSRERRGALGLPGGEAGESDAASGAAPATTPAVAAKPAAPARVAPAPRVEAPKPLRPEVLAAKNRKKIPIWAMPVLGLLPIWLFLYAEAMAPPTAKLTGALAEGTTIYGQCAGCHGATGGGGAGYQLSDGEVITTFATFESQLDFVTKGTAGFLGVPYGTSGRRIGGQKGPMPTWGGQLSQSQLIAVVCHERFTLQNLTAASPGDRAAEFTKWCSTDLTSEFSKATAAGE